MVMVLSRLEININCASWCQSIEIIIDHLQYMHVFCTDHTHLYNNQSSFWIFIGRELRSIRGQTVADAISATSQSQQF